MNSILINKSLNEVQIFETVQGEATFIGVPSFFIRLQGCSVRCFFCDEKKTWSLDSRLGANFTYEAVLDCLLTLNPNLKRVVITGGEPTEQDVLPFIKFLNASGYSVAMESAMSGTYAESVLDFIEAQDAFRKAALNLNRESQNSIPFWLTFSPKEIYSENGRASSLRAFHLAHEIKFVIADLQAVDYLEQIIIPESLKAPKPIFLVPDWNNKEKNQTYILSLLKKYPDLLRLGIQAHKYWNLA